MSRWALPSRWAARDALRAGTKGVLDVLHPLLVLWRGLVRLAAMGRKWWARTPEERRRPTLFLVAACGLLLWLMPYGPALVALSLVGAAAWCGRARARGPEAGKRAPSDEESDRLRVLYEALVPYFAVDGDPHPEPLYTLDGAWERAFEDFVFHEGRLSTLLLRYPAWFRDGEAGRRLYVEQLLAAKSGRGREYRFAWDEECNLLEMTALEPLPTGIHAQPFVTAPGETVLGFTDGPEVRRTVPVEILGVAGPRDVPPVVWRTGPRATEPHLLAMGLPGSGTSSLLRSVALQALRRGEVLVVDGDGSGEFACLAARRGVLGVESTLPGVLSALEWVERETERRLLSAGRAGQRGEYAPDGERQPLWVLLDRPAVLSHLARTEGQRDPQDLLAAPLRHGRAAGVSVVVAEQFAGTEELSEAVLAHTGARVVLGAVSPEQAGSVLGLAPRTGPAPHAPAGRGFARLGSGPVLRLQVPATPDPFDESAGEPERAAVWALLPEPAADAALSAPAGLRGVVGTPGDPGAPTARET
ncbi:hypothetical protein OG533_02365 [Streptomyces sp. NBC_01186]|uniref:hypothetical protein n=1 Tax=Streptomyces sp. NBC_01186 TaxID=2903765 RepID=UPI002E139136|nr:hypothetical protein OG533_02365 [Streptomyces sp. NBC_01186]